MELWAFISHSFYQLKKCSRTVHIERWQKHVEKAVFYPKETRRNSGHKETRSDFLLYTSCHNFPPQYKDDTVEQRPTAQSMMRATTCLLPGLSTTSTPRGETDLKCQSVEALRSRQEVLVTDSIKDGGNTDGFSYPQKNLQRSPKQWVTFR